MNTDIHIMYCHCFQILLLSFLLHRGLHSIVLQQKIYYLICVSTRSLVCCTSKWYMPKASPIIISPDRSEKSQRDSFLIYLNNFHILNLKEGLNNELAGASWGEYIFKNLYWKMIEEYFIMFVWLAQQKCSNKVETFKKF